MRLIYKDRYHYIRNNVFTIGTTNRNEYYPVYAALEDLRVNGYNTNNDIFSSHIIADVFMYYKPLAYTGGQNRTFSTIHNIPSVIAAFRGYSSMSIYDFKFQEEQHYINVSGGYIADTEDNILMVLTAKSSSLSHRDNRMNTDNISDANNADNYFVENLRLYVSTELLKNEKYKNLYKRLDKEIIQELFAMDVEVVFTTSEKIDQSLFKNDFEVPFNSITELHEHLTTGLIGRNLFLDESLFQINPIESIPADMDLSYAANIIEANLSPQQPEGVPF